MYASHLCLRRSNTLTYQDGNGRVTRAIVSAILLRFGLLPFVVPVQDKNDYFRALMTVRFDRISMSTPNGNL